jgi:two-component system, LuxR family, sensor kinase FixL
MPTRAEVFTNRHFSKTTNWQEYFSYPWRLAFVFAGYYLGSQIGFALTFRPYAVSTLWPPNAILLGTLLISPTRMWPFILLAAFPAHLAVQLGSDVPPLMVLCWFLSNTCEALIGAGLLRLFLRKPISFDTLKQTILFLFFVPFLSPFLSSFLDAAFVKANHWGAEGYWSVWRMRFFSNVVAELTLVPVIVSWSTTDFASLRKVSVRRYVEASLLLVVLLLVTLAVFDVRMEKVSATWIYLPVPILLWAATRFGFNVLSTSIAIVAFLSIWGAVNGRGPFNALNPVENAFSIQIFLVVFSVPLMLFAAVLQERKKARETALQEEERLRLALSAAKMTTWDLHIPTNHITWSKQSKKILGTDLQEKCLDLESFLAILHPDDRGRVFRVITRTIQEGGSYEVEFRIVRPSGEILWQLGKGEVLFDERAKPIRVLGVNVDITDRKRAEESRRNAEILAQSHRQELYHLSRVGMLAELSGTVAHELNQPLTAILSNAQAAQRYLEKGLVDVDELRGIVDAVVEQDRRAGDVIKRLRSLLKKGETERLPIDVNQIIQEVLGLVHGEFITHNISVITDLCENLPKPAGDRIQLQQVLMNLILNGIDAMKMAADATDRVLKVTTKVQERSTIQLSVADRGVGIPNDKLDQIFEPFYTTKENGMGLGLAISRAIVVAHGGQMKVTNNPERGVTFLLSFPTN